MYSYEISKNQKHNKLGESSSPAATNLCLSLLSPNSLHYPFFITPYPYKISPEFKSVATIFPPEVAATITP